MNPMLITDCKIERERITFLSENAVLTFDRKQFQERLQTFPFSNRVQYQDPGMLIVLNFPTVSSVHTLSYTLTNEPRAVINFDAGRVRELPPNPPNYVHTYEVQPQECDEDAEYK